VQLQAVLDVAGDDDAADEFDDPALAMLPGATRFKRALEKSSSPKMSKKRVAPVPAESATISHTHEGTDPDPTDAETLEPMCEDTR
jgi:hypothetical protein